MTAPALAVRPIGADEIDDAARFLHEYLNRRVSVAAWRTLLAPPWQTDATNRGFMLTDGDAVAGVYAAVYSERDIDGERVPVCNLAAFCVREDQRAHGLRLIRSLLGQKGYEFTDLSPSGNVIAMNERLGFRRLDTATRLTLNLPGLGARGIRVTEDHDVIAHALDDGDRRIHTDHRQAPAAHHLLVEQDGTYAYLIYRRDRRRRMPLFATPLYVGGDHDLLRAAWPAVRTRLLRHGLIATLAERRLLGFEPRFGRAQKNPRAKMIRGMRWPDDAVDYLYSELVLVSW